MRMLSGAAILVALSVSSLAAQKPQTRNGFTISFGLGGGSAGATCEGCDSDRQSAPSGYLRIGGAVRQNLILAGEINGWSKEYDEEGGTATLTIATVNFVAQWYPQPTNGFFLSAGVGTGSMGIDIKVPGFGTLSDNTTGFGYQVGTGYDIRVGNNFSLTPFATYFATAGGKFDSNGFGSGAKVDGNVFHIGLGFTWH